MSDVIETKMPIWAWGAIIVLALWGLMGMWVYYDFVTTTPEKMSAYVEAGTYTPEYAKSLSQTPTWATAVFALAVFSGALGDLLLILRRNLAKPLFLISLLFICISLGHMFLIEKVHTMMSSGQIIMECIVLALGLFAVWFSRTASARGWLK